MRSKVNSLMWSKSNSLMWSKVNPPSFYFKFASLFQNVSDWKQCGRLEAHGRMEACVYSTQYPCVYGCSHVFILFTLETNILHGQLLPPCYINERREFLIKLWFLVHLTKDPYVKCFSLIHCVDNEFINTKKNVGKVYLRLKWINDPLLIWVGRAH